MPDEMVDQLFPSLRGGNDFESPGMGKKRRRGGNLDNIYGGQPPWGGTGLPVTVPYVPGVSGMRMLGSGGVLSSGGVPSYGGLTTQQMFS